MTPSSSAAAAALACLQQHLRTLRVGVVGDVVLDRFLYGAVERISPEAPVPVVDVQREVFRLGGAANVVQNIAVLGAGVDILGVVGTDADAERLRQELDALGAGRDGLLSLAERPTALKTRVIAQHQQVVRFDRESRGALPHDIAEKLKLKALACLARWDAVIVSDYGKGVINRELLPGLTTACRERGVPLLVDPKPAHGALYAGASCMTPNAKETEAMGGIAVVSDGDAEAAGRVLLERYATDAVLVTRGEKGMTLVERDRPTSHIATTARDVYDVTGAGDTTIAVLTLARAAGCSFWQAACLANTAAGIVVGKLGTAAVSVAELENAVASGSG